MKVICPSCNGKGHVVNKPMMVFVPVISWFFAWLDKDDKESVTREECKRCNGKGYKIF